MSNKKKGFNKGQIDTIITLHLKGVSSRAICDELDVPRSRKSSVNDILARWRKGDIVHSGEVEDAETRNAVVDESVALDTLCEHPDWNISSLAKRLRSAQRTNNQLRKVQRDLFDGEEGETKSIEGIVSEVLKGVTLGHSKTVIGYNNLTTDPATLEVMLSDLQLGKLTRHFNKDTAMKGLKLYGEGILKEIHQKREKFKVERIVFELLGDLCEDNTKHGIQSAISTDCGLSEQIVLATQGIWEYILKPLAGLGVEVEVICIVGNHASSTHKGMGSFKEGKYSYDYTIFKMLEQFTEISGYDKVTFTIPEGTFGHTTIYGKHVILEHGYHNNHTEKGMIDQMRKRGAQLKVHPTYWRQGDRHHHITYGQGEQILNGAFFGVDTEGLEYSGILGFTSIPSQTLVWHTDEKCEGKGTVKDVVNIQVFVDE